MANRQFDQVMWNVRERPLSSDENQQASQSLMSLREKWMRDFAYRDLTVASNSAVGVPQGFISDSFRVDPGSGMQVSLRAGLGSQDGTGDQPTNINGCLNLDDLHPLKPLVLTGAQAINVPAADPTNPRWDIVEVKYSRTVGNSQSRGILNNGTGVFDPTLVNKTLSFVLDGATSVNGAAAINYKTGTPAGSPAVPSTDAGYIRIGRVYVPAALGSITKDLIIDDRRLLMPGGGIRVSGVMQVNHTTFVLSNAHLTSCPPGVDVGIFSYVGTTTVGIQIVGPFPNIGANQFNGTVLWNIFPNVIASTPAVPFTLTTNYTTSPSKWLPAGAPTSQAPGTPGPGTNNNVLHNSFYSLMTPMEWNAVAQQFGSMADDFIVTFDATIPVL